MKRLAVVLTVALIMCVLPMASAVSANSVGPSWIWGTDPASTDKELVLLDAWTGTEYARLALPGDPSGDTELALAGESAQLYYVNGDDSDATVYRLNPQDGSTLGTVTITGGWDVDGIGNYGGGGGYLYTSGCGAEDLHRYSAAGGGPTFYWSNVDDPQAVGGDDTGRIFTTSYNGTHHRIAEVDPVNGPFVDPLNIFDSPSQSVVGMAFDGTYLYVSDTNNMLYILDPDDGTVENSLDLGYTLYALAVTEVIPPAIEVEKVVDSFTDPDGDEIVELNEAWTWTWNITITNVSESPINNVVLKDNLGGDLKLISVDANASGNPVAVVKPAGKKVTATFDGVVIEWTGKTAKVHWSYDGIDDLASGASYTFQLTVGTDVNPGNKQQYTSTGEKIQNSGATAKGLIADLYEVEGVSDPLSVMVYEQDG